MLRPSFVPPRAIVLAVIGTDVSRFPAPAHLIPWARFASNVSEFAGRPKGNPFTGKGNRYLARVVGGAAVSAARTNTFLGERYPRIARRRGKKRAIGRSILVIIWGPALRRRRRAHRPRAGLPRLQKQPRTQGPPARPPAPRPRLHRHPQRGSLTGGSRAFRTTWAAMGDWLYG